MVFNEALHRLIFQQFAMQQILKRLIDVDSQLACIEHTQYNVILIW